MSQVFSLSYLPNLLLPLKLVLANIYSIFVESKRCSFYFAKKTRKNMYLDNFLQIGWTLTFLLQPNCIIVIQRLFSKKEMPNLVRLFFLLVFILTQNFLRKLFSFWHIFCMILTNVHVCHYYPGLFLS